MNITVCVKQTLDNEAYLEITDAGEVLRDPQSLIIDPYSEFAVEKALQITEELGGEVTLVTIGTQEAEPAIRHAFAMGAASAVRVDVDETVLDPACKARILAAALGRARADLVMGGCKSADTSSSQTMPRVAEIMGLPHVNVVTGVTMGDGAAVAQREVDDGYEEVEVALPCVLCAQQGLAEPRYPKVRDIMRSKKKPIEVLALADLGLSEDEASPRAQRLRPTSVRLKPQRGGGRIVGGELPEAVAEVAGLLHDEAKAI